jgi:predicted secreted hydrolase
VKGSSWFDQEWGSNQLTAEQIGWNWFALQFDDGTELMLYQMRLRDGGIDPTSSGTFIAADGAKRSPPFHRLHAYPAPLVDQQGDRRPLSNRVASKHSIPRSAR